MFATIDLVRPLLFIKKNLSLLRSLSNRIDNQQDISPGPHSPLVSRPELLNHFPPRASSSLYSLILPSTSSSHWSASVPRAHQRSYPPDPGVSVFSGRFPRRRQLQSVSAGRPRPRGSGFRCCTPCGRLWISSPRQKRPFPSCFTRRNKSALHTSWCMCFEGGTRD